MALNKARGNMYEFLNENGRGYTWNVIKGICPHDCIYCYMKRFPQKALRFDEQELNTNLGKDKFIFVGSSCDMWATGIPNEQIKRVLDHCLKYPDNKYLFQSKNPYRFQTFACAFPLGSILATTIESDTNYKMGIPGVEERAKELWKMKQSGFKTMVTIEPIMDFSVWGFITLIKRYEPNWVNIGADTGNNNLPEPSGTKLREFLVQLKASKIEVKQKNNLSRLLWDEVKNEPRK